MNKTLHVEKLKKNNPDISAIHLPMLLMADIMMTDKEEDIFWFFCDKFCFSSKFLGTTLEGKQLTVGTGLDCIFASTERRPASQPCLR